MPTNQYHQPIGDALPGYTPGARPAITTLSGRYCRLEKLDPARHGGDLYAIYGPTAPPANFTYLSIDPAPDRAAHDAHMQRMAASNDPYHLAICEATSGTALGTLALMRIDPANRVIEVGWVCYGDALKRSRLATEAQYLLMRYVFDELHYRRYEWKCDGLNAPSRRAAERLGFTYEGIFRQAVVYKGRNRDTAWYSLLDNEWPAQRARFERWLEPANFDAAGRQHTPL